MTDPPEKQTSEGEPSPDKQTPPKQDEGELETPGTGNNGVLGEMPSDAAL